MTSRVEILKEKLEAENDLGVFYERMTLLMEAKEKFGELPYGERYAKSFAYLLENMTVEILPQELIVGISKEIILDEEQEKVFAQACEQNNVRATDLFSFDPLKMVEITDVGQRFAPEWLCSWGHVIPDYEKLLKVGYRGLELEVQERLTDETLTPKQREFLHNTLIAVKAMQTFVLRYQELAEKMAQSCEEEQEKKRLQTIAHNCSGAISGVEDFGQALQLIWFTNLVLHTVCGARDYGFGRMDVYLNPYWERDQRAGRLSREQALELLECLFIKTNEIIGRGWEAYQPKRILSMNSIQYILVSGVDQEGNDCTNDVSYMILQAVDELKIKQPTVNVRYHEKIDPKFFEEACRVAASGLGYPSFFNDDVVIPALLQNGIEKKDAIDYGYYGCNNSFLPGKEDELRESWHSGPKYLEFALNHGVCMMTQKVIGAITKPAWEIESMEDIYEALRVQFAKGIQAAKDHVEQSDAYWRMIREFNFESVVMSNCIQKAESFNGAGSKYRHFNNHLVGMATLANSLYAIQQLVFVEKKLTLTALIDMLKQDWPDEALRAYVEEHMQKYGNDLKEVDDIAAKVSGIFVEEVRKASPMDNGRVLYPSIYSLWHQRELGKVCAASADGRKAGTPISESQSPVYGSEKNGPTAALNSVAKLPLRLTPSGGINVKFQPKLFQMENGHQNLAALIRGFFRQGGMHMQINVISRETLEDAKKNPNKHKNLLVRVVGYSAYFVTLSPEQQDEIIQRTAL